MRDMFRAFQHRNYQLFFAGQTISLIGTWVQQVAMLWLVYTLTRSSALLGVVSLMWLFPVVIISPLAGGGLDQWNRRNVLIATQTLAGIQALILALLVYTHTMQVWHVLLLSFGVGLVNAFDMPGRQAFLTEMVNREDLGNAIALNSSQFNIARLIGPVVGASLMAIVGAGMCFLINGISFIAVIGALLAMKVPHRTPPTKGKNIFQDMREGWRFTSRFVPISSLLILLAAVSFTGGMFMVLLPAYAHDFFKGQVQTYGILSAAIGVGALLGAVMLTLRKNVKGFATLSFYSAAISGASLVLLAFTNQFWLACVLLAFNGFGAMVNMAATNTLVQSLVHEDIRGRVMSFYTMSFLGTMPVGSFLGGSLAEGFGLPLTVGLSGGITCLAAIWFYFRLPAVRAVARPVLQERGMIPRPEASQGQ